MLLHAAFTNHVLYSGVSVCMEERIEGEGILVTLLS